MRLLNLTNTSALRWLAILMLAALALRWTAPVANAADSKPPGKMTFQGFLTDASSPPVPLGNASPVNKEVTFRIYNGATAGDVKWAETQIVTVDKGHFSVLLGEGSAVSGQPHANDLSGVFIGADASERWMGITVDGAEITPRIQFFAAPYAHLARSATTLVDPSGQALFNLANGKLEGSSELTLNPGPLTVEGNASVSGTTTLGSANIIGKLGIGIGTTTPSHRLQIGKGDNEGTPGLLINTGWSNPGNRAEGRPLDVQVRGDSKLVVNTHGYVGMRTSTPSAPLEVRHSGAETFGIGVLIRGPNNDGPRLALDKIGVKSWGVGIHQGANASQFGIWEDNEVSSGHGNARLIIESGGNVGIGTTDPTAPLDVRGWTDHNRTFAYFNGNADIGKVSNAGAAYSILASHRIGGLEFNAFSDARTKKVVGRSDGQRDLEMIQKLRVTDYQLIDEATEGKKVQKGFIAQEVQAVIPEAVTSQRRFIPDIYALASSAKFNERTKTMAVNVVKEHGLKVGDKVRMITTDSTIELGVTQISSATEFVVGNVEKAAEQVFVFGKEVSDFRILNYDRIFTTGISAIQELDRQVQALKKSEARIAQLEEKAARVETLERELASLKAIVSQMASKSSGSDRVSTVAATAR